MGKSKKTKSQYWQMVRGICILAVIMIHCPSGQNYAKIVTPAPSARDLSTTLPAV